MSLAHLDPFLQSQASLVHQTIPHPLDADSDTDELQRQKVSFMFMQSSTAESESERKEMMEDDDDKQQASDAAAAVPASIASSPMPLPRDIAFLESHVAAYQNRIESILTYLQEQRFGHAPTSEASISIGRLNRSQVELEGDVRSLEYAWSTWRLLIELRQSDEARSNKPCPPSLLERFSPQLVAARLVATPSHPILRLLRILNWVESLAEFLLRIDGNGEVGGWKRSLRRLQKSHEGDTQRDFLDPDIELRLRKGGLIPSTATVLDPQDTEEEQRLLEQVWQLLRAGRLHEGIQLCSAYGSHWRAASLFGGERYHDDGKLNLDGTFLRVGNPNRLLWRHTCRQLSLAPGISAVERSIYGILGGELPSALAYRGQFRYEEALFCYLKLMFEEIVDEFVAVEGKSDTGAASIPRSTTANSIPRDLSSLLQQLESPLNTNLNAAVHQQAKKNPWIRLQKWLMLDERDSIEQELVQTIRMEYVANGGQSTVASGTVVDKEIPVVNHTYLLFAVHLYLYLHPLAPHSEPLNPAGKFIFHSYLSYLETQTTQHALVPAYVQYLSPQDRISFYVRFLQKIPSLSLRQNLLAAFEEYCPAEERLEVTRNLVTNILVSEGEEHQVQQQGGRRLLTATPAAAAASASAAGAAPIATVPSSGLTNLLASPTISPADLEKITAIDCFDISSPSSSPAVLHEALNQVNTLYRHFCLKDHYVAMKKFTEHLQGKQWDQQMYRRVQQQQLDQMEFSPQWYALDREYTHWKLLLRCFHWIDAWTIQHSAKPVAPIFNRNQYTNPNQRQQAEREYQIFAPKYRAYEQAHQEWERNQIDVVEQTVVTFKELLEMDDTASSSGIGGSSNGGGGGGWMTPIPASLAPHQLDEIRRKMIPLLVQMLIQLCRESKQEELGLSIVDVLASPLLSLHHCFSLEQKRALMLQFQQAYLRLQKRKEEEEVASAESQGMVPAPSHSAASAAHAADDSMRA